MQSMKSRHTEKFMKVFKFTEKLKEEYKYLFSL